VFGKSIFQRYSNVINLLSRIMDPLLVSLAAYIAFEFRFDNDVIVSFKDYKVLIGFAVFATIIIFPMFNMYSSWRGFGLFHHAKVLLFAWLSVILFIIILLFVFKISYDYSRVWLGLWAIVGFVLLLVGRVSIFSFLQFQRKLGRNLRYVVVIGAGDLGKKVLNQINESKWTGYKVVAFFDDDQALISSDIYGVRVLGNVLDAATYINRNRVDEVWLTLPLRAELRMKELLHCLRHTTVNIKLVPDIFGFSLLYHSMSEIAGLPAVNLSVSPMDGANRVYKAIEDRVIAFVILFFIFPVLLLIAIAVKVTSPGPVFYKQERVSWNGKKFTMLKFRSMFVDNEDGSVIWGKADCKKITRLGQFLRKSSLDELPQFINVLMGDMSIVGPRPERSEFVEKFKYEIPGYMQKHMVKAGITGWAQVNGWRGDTCLKTRIEHDLFYIENWSIWFDIKIILLTLFKGFINKNAY